MDNEYLWNKTGEDKEIERLENALQSFRYKPMTPPELPAKVLQLEEKPRFSFFPKIFRFAIAGMACIAIGFVSTAIWLNATNKQIEDIGAYSEPLVKPIKVDTSTPTVNLPPQITQLVDRKPVGTKSDALPKTTYIAYRQKTQKVRANKAIQLTKEEKDAYDQLMLALSITGSQLKEVKDKANGINETTAEIKSLR